jgi:Tfp pilus assembly protein PilN
LATYTDPNSAPPSSAASSPLAVKPAINPGIYLGFVAAIISLGFAAYFYYQTVQVHAKDLQLQKSIQEQKTALQKLSPVADELTAYDLQGKQLHIIFDTQKRWEVILGRIEKRLYKNMAVTSMQITDQGQLTLSGTTPSYEEYAKMYSAFTSAEAKKYFLRVKPTTISKSDKLDAQQGKIAFTLIIKLNPTILATDVPGTSQ